MTIPDSSTHSTPEDSNNLEALSVTYTIFDDLKARTKRERTAAWPTIAKLLAEPPIYPTKADAPLISFAAYDGTTTPKGSLRHKGAITEVYGLEGDYDAEDITIEQAAQTLSQHHIAAVLYASPSSEAIDWEDVRIRGPRWRIIAPLSQGVPPEQREHLMAKLNTLLNGILTPESFRLSQAFYIGRVTEGEPVFKSIILPGQPLDLALAAANVAETYPLNFKPLTERHGLGRGNLQDPTLKDDVVGAFCRAYSAPQALETFLSDVFTHVSGNRYSWVGHDAKGGVYVCDGNHHVGASHASWPFGTDVPANTFDLVRQFRFDPELLEPSDLTPPYERESYKLMAAWVRELPEVQAELGSWFEAPDITSLDLLDACDCPLSPPLSLPPPIKVDSDPMPPPFPGAMAELCNAILDSAHRQQPTLTTGAALLTMASACPGFYRLPNDGRMNLFFIGVVGTALGKEHPRSCAETVAELIGARVIGGVGMTGQGLETELPDNDIPRQAVLLSVDEAGHWVAGMTEQNAASHQAVLAGNLLRLYSASARTYLGRSLAGKPAKRYLNPTVSLMGFSTPEKLAKSVSMDNIADGLLGRMLVLRGTQDAPARRHGGGFVVPESVRLKAHQLNALANSGMATDPATGEVAVDVARDGITIRVPRNTDRALDEVLARFESEPTDGVKGTLSRRSFEKLQRIAGVLAIWDNPGAPTMTPAHVEWAEALVRHSNATVLTFTGEDMVDAQLSTGRASSRELLAMVLERCAKALAGEYAANNESERDALDKGWVPHSLLLRRSKLSGKDFATTVSTLVEAGQLELKVVKEEGRKPIRLYRPTGVE